MTNCLYTDPTMTLRAGAKDKKKDIKNIILFVCSSDIKLPIPFGILIQVFKSPWRPNKP